MARWTTLLLLQPALTFPCTPIAATVAINFT
jgi:hypothetical protein